MYKTRSEYQLFQWRFVGGGPVPEELRGEFTTHKLAHDHLKKVMREKGCTDYEVFVPEQEDPRHQPR